MGNCWNFFSNPCATPADPIPPPNSPQPTSPQFRPITVEEVRSQPLPIPFQQQQ